ncbi:MAG: hypothetical protein HOB79_02375 [Rhodospirillaceae bacterium]|nr:hypothetical protein [Rhodospirillaceae bacterium]
MASVRGFYYDIITFGARRETPHLHVFDHTLAQQAEVIAFAVIEIANIKAASIRKHGWPAFSSVPPGIRSQNSTNSCRSVTFKLQPKKDQNAA